MTLQAVLRNPFQVEVSESAFLTGSPRRVGWDKAGVCGQTSRAPFKQLVVGSSRNPGHPRAPIWKGRLLSNEALRAVQELKRAHVRKDNARLSNVLKSTVSRLVKFDMLAVLGELRRQNECELAVLVFDVVRKEFWYKPEEGLLADLISTLARNKRVEDVEKLFVLASTEGMQPSMGLYTDVLSAHVGQGNLQKALDVYDELRKAGYAPCNPALGILRKALEANGDHELAATLVKEFKDAHGHDIGAEEEQVDLPSSPATLVKEFRDGRGHDVHAENEKQLGVQQRVLS
ncbi:hypothetical protein GOP47_0008110 [Adiantum capillus-veneris]|uniref:Pentatricopeptide repeat-containing protein n=1 Tax=Adiantum capillus-veneris TaxID=13818 RepID=A0A9D4ZKC8_ADICA|nr:hypothetical protein GOP47_0008110 [Adiantum capillus-veneris]